MQFWKIRELVMKENLQLYGLKVFWEIVEELGNAVLALFQLKGKAKFLSPLTLNKKTQK